MRALKGGIPMEDERIVGLYFERDEQAIEETQKKYDRYLAKIAYNILADIEDSKESVNDTYLKAWNSIPPSKPQSLSAYLGRIVRQNSIDIYRKKHSRKRFFCEYGQALSELDADAVEGETVESRTDLRLLGEKISEYLNSLSEEAASIFVCRYYFCDSIKSIAESTGYSESKIKSSLHRTRIGLKDFLRREGVIS